MHWKNKLFINYLMFLLTSERNECFYIKQSYKTGLCQEVKWFLIDNCIYVVVKVLKSKSGGGGSLRVTEALCLLKL